MLLQQGTSENREPNAAQLRCAAGPRRLEGGRILPCPGLSWAALASPSSRDGLVPMHCSLIQRGRATFVCGV